MIKLLSCFRTVSLVPGVILCLSACSFAQALPTPTQPPGNEQRQGMVEAYKMTATNLAANGGSIAKDVYTNSIYGFSVKLPAGWVVVPAKSPVAPNPNSAEAAVMKNAQINHVLLLMTENLPLKKSVERKSLQIVGTRLLKTPSPTEGQDYLNYSIKTAKERNMPVEYGGDPKEVKINGKSFWMIGMNQKTAGAVQHVEQYVTAQGSNLLQFLLVSPDEQGLKQLQPSMQSVQFTTSTPMPPTKHATPKRATASAKQKSGPSAQ
jgi:hypothetical protein